MFVDVGIGVAKDAPTASAHARIAPAVVCLLFVRTVGRTVQLDHQTCPNASEVSDVRTDWMLAAKPMAVAATFQARPQYCLRVRQPPPKRHCERTRSLFVVP